MKFKVEIGIEELGRLVKGEEERDLIAQTLILYPVTWDIVREMILQRLTCYQIKAMCDAWYRNGQPIREAWDSTKAVLDFII